MSRPGPPREARAVRGEWDLLSAAGPAPDVFDPASVAALPDAARRWLSRVIAPGTPLWSSVELTMSGRIRIGAWRRFTARQVLAPERGYVWAARASFLGLPVTGYDRMGSGSAEMRWRLLGLLPVMSAAGADVLRSAAGRLAGEFVFVPTTFRSAAWRAGTGADTATAVWGVGATRVQVELRVAPDGRLLEVALQRWGQPGGGAFGYHRFGVAVGEHRTFAGVTIPSFFRAGWWWGTDRQDEGEFFRARISDAVFRP